MKPPPQLFLTLSLSEEEHYAYLDEASTCTSCRELATVMDKHLPHAIAFRGGCSGDFDALEAAIEAHYYYAAASTPEDSELDTMDTSSSSSSRHLPSVYWSTDFQHLIARARGFFDPTIFPPTSSSSSSSSSLFRSENTTTSTNTTNNTHDVDTSAAGGGHGVVVGETSCQARIGVATLGKIPIIYHSEVTAASMDGSSSSSSSSSSSLSSSYPATGDEKEEASSVLRLSRVQVACLLANMFLCVFPSQDRPEQGLMTSSNYESGYSRRGGYGKRGTGGGGAFSSMNNKQNTPQTKDGFNEASFNRLLNEGNPCKVEKIRMILHYWERLASGTRAAAAIASIAASATDKSTPTPTPSPTFTTPTGSMYIRRVCSPRSFDIASFLSTSSIPLSPIQVQPAGLGMETSRTGDALQADFANQYIGGGTLGNGAVQEETRFMISPELIVSMLLCPRMKSFEAILLTGAEQYSACRGTGSALQYTGDFVDPTPTAKEKVHSLVLAAAGAETETGSTTGTTTDNSSSSTTTSGAAVAIIQAMTSSFADDAVQKNSNNIPTLSSLATPTSTTTTTTTTTTRSSANHVMAIAEALRGIDPDTKLVTNVAIDAIHFRLGTIPGDRGGKGEYGRFTDTSPQAERAQFLEIQLRKQFLHREALKAFVGFSPDAKPECPAALVTSVATGRWGCGVFNGHTHIKTLLQWIAITSSGNERKHMRFYPFRNNDGLADAIQEAQRVIFGAEAAAAAEAVVEEGKKGEGQMVDTTSSSSSSSLRVSPLPSSPVSAGHLYRALLRHGARYERALQLKKKFEEEEEGGGGGVVVEGDHQEQATIAVRTVIADDVGNGVKRQEEEEGAATRARGEPWKRGSGKWRQSNGGGGRGGGGGNSGVSSSASSSSSSSLGAAAAVSVSVDFEEVELLGKENIDIHTWDWTGSRLLQEVCTAARRLAEAEKRAS